MAEPAAGASSEAVLDLARLEAALPELHANYVSARPFPHAVLDDFLVPACAAQAAIEFPTLDPEAWINYLHVNERKYGNPDPTTWGPTLRSIADELMSPRFVTFLCGLTGVDDLIIDPSFEGGDSTSRSRAASSTSMPTSPCIPSTATGDAGSTSCCSSTQTGPTSTAGISSCGAPDMQRCEQKIAPIGNRVVIFNTDSDAFHGHPDPMRSPAGVAPPVDGALLLHRGRPAGRPLDGVSGAAPVKVRAQS